MPEPVNKWFNPKGSTVQQTEPSRPIKELQLDERFDKLESALIHPFKSIENIEKFIENEQALIERLVQDNLIRRSFQDTPISIGLTASYQLEYHRHLYVYLYSNTGFTLQVSTGATQVIPANYWTNVSYPRGSYFTVSGGSDTTLQVCWVRACDTPMEMATQQVAIPGNVNVTQGTTPWSTNQVGIANAALSSVVSSASTGVLLAANANRKAASFFNDSTSTLFIAQAATASNTSYTVQVVPGGFYELSPSTYTGIVSGIWSVANGNARITENS